MLEMGVSEHGGDVALIYGYRHEAKYDRPSTCGTVFSN